MKVRKQDLVYLFIEILKDSFFHESFSNRKNESIALDYAKFNHHCEIYDIVITKNGKKKSALSIFKDNYLILTQEDKEIIIKVSTKNKLKGLVDISGYKRSLKSFLKKNVRFYKMKIDDIIIL